MASLKKASFLALGLGIALSVWLRLYSIGNTSPTFDEPFHLFRAIFYQQTGTWYGSDVHPSGFPWLISKLSFLAPFADARGFASQREVFFNPYQYRLDLFSQMPGTDALDRFRAVFQIPWALATLALWFLAGKAKMATWQKTLLCLFFLLEPSLVGLSTLVASDSIEVCLLLIATALSLPRSAIAWIASFCVFSFAWAVKGTAVLWLLPLTLAVRNGTLPLRTAGIGASALAGGLALGWALGGWDPTMELAVDPTRRLAYLDGLVFSHTPHSYFLQAVLCKSSFALLFLDRKSVV